LFIIIIIRGDVEKVKYFFDLFVLSEKMAKKKRVYLFFETVFSPNGNRKNKSVPFFEVLARWCLTDDMRVVYCAVL
jgi:hypothetical protein